MTGLYIFLGLAAIVGIIVLLDFLGPVKSEKPFWIAVKKIRSILDKGSYFIICAVAVGCILIVMVNIFMSLIGK